MAGHHSIPSPAHQFIIHNILMLISVTVLVAKEISGCPICHLPFAALISYFQRAPLDLLVLRLTALRVSLRLLPYVEEEDKPLKKKIAKFNILVNRIKVYSSPALKGLHP
jgi:hypothetical protein